MQNISIFDTIDIKQCCSLPDGPKFVFVLQVSLSLIKELSTVPAGLLTILRYVVTFFKHLDTFHKNV